MTDDLTTRKSLLHRLKTGSTESDWEQLYRQYKSVILSFCHKRGLDEFTSQDVLQETMVLLIRKLPQFEYDPARGRFLNWLLTLVEGKVRDARRRALRASMISLDYNDLAPNLMEALIATPPESSSAAEVAWRQAMIEEGLRRLEEDPRIKSQSFAVFHAYAIQNQPASEIAQQFGLQENAVYQIKNRMLRRLQAEVRDMENPLAI